jgi:methylglutaconyl-CoA hydratase
MRKVETALEGGVFTVTLADEPNRNALSIGLLTELVAAIDRADTDDEIRVVVLTNRGHIFCAGADLRERSNPDISASTVDMATVFGRIRRSPKPFVGRIAGHAIAGGLGLAASLDISIAVDDAKMGFTEVRIGVAPAIISVICLPKMRRADAAAAFLQGNRFLAPEAVRLGLINESVPAGELDAAVAAVVADLLLGAPGALAAAKQLLTKVPAMEFDPALEWAANLSAGLFAGPEGREGMAAYLEKRPPAWAPRGTAEDR